MKKILFLSFVLSLVFVGNAKAAESLNEKLSGRIVVAVEKNGEAYWVNPDDKEAYYLGRPQDAFNLMRNKGLGISEKDFNQFISYGPPKSLAGKIILRVQNHGEAYYVNPLNLEFNYLGSPTLAFRVMRNLGLGINNDNLNQILSQGEATNSSLVYKNSNFGFQLTLNNFWKDYRALETPSRQAVEIQVPTSDPTWSGGYYGPLTIIIYSKSEWDAKKKDQETFGGPGPGFYITENETSVFAYARAMDAPGDFTNKFENLDISNVIKSFKLIN